MWAESVSRWSISELTFHSYPQLSNAHLPLYPERSQLYLLRCQEPSRQVVDRLALCGLDLLSGHHLQKFECLEQSPGICFVEWEQIALEFWVVEIQLNQVPLSCCSSASSSATLGYSIMARKARSSRAQASCWWSQSSESGMVWAVLITHTSGLPVFKGSI